MTASEHRARARAALKNNWGWAVLTSFVASLLGGISGSGVSFNFNTSSTQSISFDDMPEEALMIFVGIMLVAGLVALVIGVVKLIVGSVVGLGYRKYLLDLIDGGPAEFKTLFSQFSRLGQAVLLALLRSLVALPVVLVVLVMVPLLMLGGTELLAFGMFILMLVMLGVIIYVNYGFAQADYIMAEDSSCRAVDAMKRSWAMMNGRRWDLFVLGLSFIGWTLLTLFTCGLGGLALTPYVQTANASFYREMNPNIHRKPFPQETAPEETFTGYTCLTDGNAETGSENGDEPNPDAEA